MPDRSEAEKRLAVYGQQHVLRWFDELSEQRQQRLLDQLAALDLDWLQRVQASTAAEVHGDRHVSPCEDVVRAGDANEREALEAGEQALRDGRVAALVVAGGQGSRLGFDGPKGAYPIGAVSGATLFQLHAERLLAAGRRHGKQPPLYLMTSETNHQATVDLFAEHRLFGLPEQSVLIFQQGMAPAVDTEGKLLMNAADRLVMAPNGNGGTFDALRDGGAFDHMAKNGVDILAYIHVDNPLAPTCDPLFVGHHLLRGSQFSCKAIPKTGPAEKVGSFALVDGRLCIVEYTELPTELAEATDDDGRLQYGLSNPGLYLWSGAFAEAQAARDDLPYHRAFKKIKHLDDDGNLVKPDAPCGYKFEAFAMDTLADAGQTMLLELPDRDTEFAPVKNASGVDSPDSARRLMTELYGEWIQQAGGTVQDHQAQIEISPLYALDAAELGQKLQAGFVVDADIYLQ